MYDWLKSFKRIFGSGAGHLDEYAGPPEGWPAYDISDELLLRSVYQAKLELGQFDELRLADQDWLVSSYTSEGDIKFSRLTPEEFLLQRNGNDEDIERPVGGGLRNAGGEK